MGHLGGRFRVYFSNICEPSNIFGCAYYASFFSEKLTDRISHN